MGRKLGSILLLTAAMAATSGCDSRSPAPAQAAATTAPSATTAPEPSSPATSQSYVASGPLVVENQLDVAAQREGVVAEIMADTGRHVRKGDLLARLDDRQLTADLAAATARARSIEADLKNWEAAAKVLETDRKRSEQMWEAGLITQQQLDHDRYKLEGAIFEVERERENLKNAVATRQSLELELEKTRIEAPFDGVIARRYVRVGQKVAIGDRIFWLTATAPLRVRFTLPQRFAGSVKPGQGVKVSADAVAGETEARIIQVSPVVDPSSGTIEVLAELAGSPEHLRPGMTAEVRVAEPR